MDKGTAKDFFSHFSGQRESNSEFTVGRLFVSILKKWENHWHIASPSLQTLDSTKSKKGKRSGMYNLNVLQTNDRISPE